MTPREFAQYVREQTDILRLVSDYVTLKKQGSNYVALCPFHRERTPSFAVHPGKQIFKCFGCGLGGDVFAFVMQIEGCSWWEAVRWVAEKNGIPIPSFSSRAEASASEAEERWRRRLFQINAWAGEFFQRCLHEPQGKEARTYLAERGIRPETIRRFGLGYAPESWSALSEYLTARGVTRQELERSGLVSVREDRRGYYDRFRHRLIFPIRDLQGRILGFGARTLADREPKYVNSPETAVYTKGRHLFGLYEAREAIRRAQEAVLVEGYFDWLTLVQHGIENVVATLGTALTPEQARLLRRFTDRVLINFDADRAGRRAMSRSLETLISEGLEVSVLVLPEGDDPDSFVRRQGAQRYAELMRAAQPYLDFLLDEALQGASFPLRPSLQARALKSVLPYLAQIPDPIESLASADYVARRLHMDVRLVREEVKRQRRLRSPQLPGDRATEELRASLAPGRDIEGAELKVTESERLLLEVLLHAPENVRARIWAEVKPEDVQGLPSERLFTRLREVGSADYATLVEGLRDDPRLLDLLERALMADITGTPDQMLERARSGLRGLRRERWQREMAALQAEIERLAPEQREKLHHLLLRKQEVAAALARDAI